MTFLSLYHTLNDKVQSTEYFLHFLDECSDHVVIMDILVFTETLDRALACGFSSADDYLQLWHCYCDYMRRRVQDWTEGEWKGLKETVSYRAVNL